MQDYKKVDRSDPIGVLYFFIRMFSCLPTAILREILMITIFRKIFFYFFKKIMDKQLETRHEFPQKVQKDKHALMYAIFEVTQKTVFDAPNRHVKRKRMRMFLDIFLTRLGKIEKYKKEHGEYPPGFLVIGIGKFCNLNCTGCYANSDSAASEKLSWEMMDWILTEKKRLWGSYFTVITGGEPMVWKSEGKDLFDLAEKHSDQLFMFYTNGTLIDEKAVKRMNELGNITPAISVEGYEKETDARRGKGTYAKIMKAMKLMKENHVGFGISITATKENVDMLSKDELYDFYFNECGASYGWIFQYMPIGRSHTLDLLVPPEKRLKLLRHVQHLIRDKKYFITDFWNSGTCVEGCISAGRYGGMFYIDWNGNVAPCAFNPYSPVNIYDIYKQGKDLNDMRNEPFFKAIRDWQDSYGLRRNKDEIGNWILPCISKDHYKDLRPMIDKYKPEPIDEPAAEALKDDKYKEGLIQHGEDLAEAIDPVWEKEYIGTDK
ncbi:MAG: radical SAM protein [Victivallales bacterium]|nr:radical SAM protein [Victivallales bacterium]MCF7888555.1 radical SAM protein [Victivallales bacterium]